MSVSQNSSNIYVHSSPPKAVSGSGAIIRQWIKNGDIERLEGLVLEGQGARLLGLTETTNDNKMKTFLKSIPGLMAKVDFIHDAVIRGSLRETQAHVDKKKLAGARDAVGRGIPHKAVLYNNRNILEWLAKKHPEILNLKDNEGRSCLHYSSASRDPEGMYDLLVGLGCNPELIDLHGQKPSYYISHPEELDIEGPMTRSLSRGKRRRVSPISPPKRKFIASPPSITRAQIRIWIHEKDIPKLEKIVWSGHGDKLLLETTNNGKVRRFLDNVPHLLSRIKSIHTAAINNDVDAMKDMRRKNLEVVEVFKAKDSHGLTPLHKAVGLGNRRCVEYLIYEVPDLINEPDELGRVPLSFAARDEAVYSFLLKNGANENILDQKGKSPAYYQAHPHDLDVRHLRNIPDAPRVSGELLGWDRASPTIPSTLANSSKRKSSSGEFSNNSNESNTGITGKYDLDNVELNEDDLKVEDYENDFEPLAPEPSSKISSKQPSREPSRQDLTEPSPAQPSRQESREPSRQASRENVLSRNSNSRADSRSELTNPPSDAVENTNEEMGIAQSSKSPQNETQEDEPMEQSSRKPTGNSRAGSRAAISRSDSKPELTESGRKSGQLSRNESSLNQESPTVTEEDMPMEHPSRKPTGNSRAGSRAAISRSGSKPELAEGGRKSGQLSRNGSSLNQESPTVAEEYEAMDDGMEKIEDQIPGPEITEYQSLEIETERPASKLEEELAKVCYEEAEVEEEVSNQTELPEQVVEQMPETSETPIETKSRKSSRAASRVSERKTPKPEESVPAVENEADDLNEGGDEIDKALNSGDMEALVDKILEGKGGELLNRASSVKSREVQEFLLNVPAYLAKISAIHKAASNGNLRDLQSLLDRKRLALAKDSNGRGPLHSAVLNNHTSVARYLASNYPQSLKALDKNGRSPLHYASTLSDSGTLYKYLVNLGADPNVKDNEGNTPGIYLRNRELLTHKELLGDGQNEEPAAAPSPSQSQGPAVVERWERPRTPPARTLELLEQFYNTTLMKQESLWTKAWKKLLAPSNDSIVKELVAKYLNRETFDLLKLRGMSEGESLLDVIKFYPQFFIVAPAHDAYDVYQELFVPAILDHNRILGDFTGKTSILKDPLLQITLPQVDLPSKFVTQVRIRVSRNIRPYSFLPQMKREELERAATLLRTGVQLNLPTYNVEEIDKEVMEELKARCWLPEATKISRFWPKSRYFILSHDNTVQVWINAEDHLDIIVTSKYGKLNPMFDTLQEIYKMYAQEFQFYENSQFGFLTVDPLRCGTGMKIIFRIRLPTLMKEKNELLELCTKFNLSIRWKKISVDRLKEIEPNDWIELENHASLGKDELTIAQELCESINSLIRAEEERTRYLILLEKEASKNKNKKS